MKLPDGSVFTFRHARHRPIRFVADPACDAKTLRSVLRPRAETDALDATVKP